MHTFGPYTVGRDGSISTQDRGVVRKVSVNTNQHGHPYVHLTLDGVRKTFLVRNLVAAIYVDHDVPEDMIPLCTSVINKDGDLTNNLVANLAWRTRRYAGEYRDHLKFHKKYGPVMMGPILCEDNEVVYRDTWEAASSLGIIEHDIVKSCIERIPVPLLRFRFTRLEPEFFLA
jgi:hypothetical protein